MAIALVENEGCRRRDAVRRLKELVVVVVEELMEEGVCMRRRDDLEWI